MKIIIYSLSLVILCCLIFSEPAGAQFWVENWNYGGYRSTNFEKTGFAGVLARSEGRFGIHLIPVGWSFIDPYLVYYGVFSQDTAYWNNNLVTGFGVRVRPFLGYQPTSWINEWLPDVRVFCESLSIQYLKDSNTALNVDKTQTTDVKYGIDIWHEWNLDKPNPFVPWAELWSNFSYRNTNFQSAWADSLFGSFQGSYLFYFQPKIGWHLGRRAEPYLKAELVSCSQSFSWFNNLAYGLGIRVEPFRDEPSHIFRKLKVFAEYMKINYTRSHPAENPPPSQKPDNDLRFGIDLSYGL